jgi:type II secretory pathway pseudopilin PulG
MRRGDNNAGFTIAELLIAIAITLLLVTILFRVFTAAASQWQAADQRIDAFRDARAAMQLMARDLGRADVHGSPQMLTLADPSADFAKEAYAVTPISNNGKSELCTVGYYLSYDAVTHAYSLKRLFKNSDLTSTSLAHPSPDFTTLYAKDSPTPDEVIPAYVWDLEIRPGVGKDVVAVTTASDTWNWLEIRFKSMSPAAARKVRATAVSENTWLDPTQPLYKTLILPSEQQFVSRVTLRLNQ